ncbi:hypothetical protein EX30DRAFT_165054 [Ascodesmis nigricans]|uniref:Uncharacterized protein n=1 Tax=Ascodesmis nigricans TaxID=341454 RepID=A0A4S2MMA9_9PEZI|nr:hypothetical protein EX30DRAFT_165054 [Ascodesmis nigricans]
MQALPIVGASDEHCNSFPHTLTRVKTDVAFCTARVSVDRAALPWYGSTVATSVRALVVRS